MSAGPFSFELRDALDAGGWSIAAAAREFGVSRACIYQWLAGAEPRPLMRVGALATLAKGAPAKKPLDRKAPPDVV